LLSLPINAKDESLLFQLPFIDKILHAFLFGVFFLLLYIGLAKQYFFKKSRYLLLVISVLFTVVYASLTELFQKIIFTYRSADIFDFFADILGVVFVITFYFFKNFFNSTKNFFVI